MHSPTRLFAQRLSTQAHTSSVQIFPRQAFLSICSLVDLPLYPKFYEFFVNDYFNDPLPVCLCELLISLKFFIYFQTLFLKFVLFMFGCARSLLLWAGFLQLQRAVVRCTGFSLQWLLLFPGACSRPSGFSSCSTQAQQMQLWGSRAWAQQLWYMDLVAPLHAESSQNRDRTCVPCIDKWFLIHCATSELPLSITQKKLQILTK